MADDLTKVTDTKRAEAERYLDNATLLARWKDLPNVDPVKFRADVDSVLDHSL